MKVGDEYGFVSTAQALPYVLRSSPDCSFTTNHSEPPPTIVLISHHGVPSHICRGSVALVGIVCTALDVTQDYPEADASIEEFSRRFGGNIGGDHNR